jgi:hypothetical protein
VFSPAKVVFAGIGVLLLVRHYFISVCGLLMVKFQAAKDLNAREGILLDLFSQIERFFHRLEIYTEVTPTTAMTEIITEILAEVLAIIGIATKEVKRRRMSE